jgi:hypothetical protein
MTRGHAYGLFGRIVVWAVATLTLVSLLSLLFTFGVVEAGSPLGAIGNMATPRSFLLVSVRGILLWLAGANRWAAGLMIALFPVGIVFGMLQLVPALTPLVGLVPLLAFIALGVDLWQRGTHDSRWPERGEPSIGASAGWRADVCLGRLWRRERSGAKRCEQPSV